MRGDTVATLAHEMKSNLRAFRHTTLASLLAAAVALHAVAVQAQSDAGPRTLAVQLFDEAEALLLKDRVAEACPKYAESYRLDPQLGVLTYLAECYEKNGQLASAWSTFRDAEDLARRRGDARAEPARQRAAALEPKLSYVVIQVPEGVRAPGLEVLRDGTPIAQVLWGTRTAVDTGTHRVEARAPGHKPWLQQVTIADAAQSITVEVPKLAREPAADHVGAGAAGPSAARDNPGASGRIAAIAVGGIGIVGVGVGGFFGLSAQASLSDAKGLCNEADYCTPRGDELRRSAKSKALVATVATGVGVAALVTAGILWFRAPRADISSAPARKPAWALAPAQAGWGLEMSRAF